MENLSAPSAVQNLNVIAADAGKLLLRWEAPAGGGATSYTVKMTTIAGYGSSSQTQVTTNTSVSYTGLLPSNSYAFSVTASNAAGTGIAAQTSFGQAPISFLYPAVVAATGQDGSIWVVNYSYTVDDAGIPAYDGSSLQQIVNQGGIWTAQPGIEFPYLIEYLTPGLDGSVWVANPFDNSVQQIVNTDGVLTAQPPIVVSSEHPNGPGVASTVVSALTTGLDGSIWVACEAFVRQIVNQGGVWTAQPQIWSPKAADPSEKNVFWATSLTPGLDGSIWVPETCVRPDGSVDLTPGFWTGPDGQPVPAYYTHIFLQQIVNQGGVWTAHIFSYVNQGGVWVVQPGIEVGLSGQEIPTLGSVTTNFSSPYELTTGLDGSIWVAHGEDSTSFVQQVVNKNGVWTAQPLMDMQGFFSPLALTTGVDGSIWVLNSGSGGSSLEGSVQQIVNDNGAWTAQPVIRVGYPRAFTTGQDGSIWVANVPIRQWRLDSPLTGNVQQIVLPPQSGPKDLKAVSGPATGEMTLSWQPPPADGGTPVIYYTVTALQGMTSQTIRTSATSVTFSGLQAGEGTTYFTVTATNFAGTSPTVVLRLGPDGKPLPTTNSGIGIVSDGTSFVGGGFDGNGYAYSWEALGGAPTLGWNGVTFDLGSPNQPNFTWAAEQKIDVAQGDFNTLNLAGAAVNGSQANQQITLTYTDGSTVVWTQSFSDWCSPQNYGHEAIVSTQAYRDTSSGGTNQTTNHVYGYSYTIPSGKALASITLPTNQNVRLLDIQMSNSTSVNLSNAYTSWGIANGNTQAANHQGFDGGGYYYYSGNLQSLIAWSGATFYLGPVPNSKNGQNNFVQGKGQTIDLPQGEFGWLYLAGAAANGNQTNQVMTLTFSDGSTETWTQSFSDWCGPQNYAGETIIQMQPNWVNQVGNVHSQTNYVYGYAYQIPAGKALVSVKLPNNSNVGILGMAMAFVGKSTSSGGATVVASGGTESTKNVNGVNY
ncbi:MAG: fibronectin type III domain-containing protein [Cyanobium sp.]